MFAISREINTHAIKMIPPVELDWKNSLKGIRFISFAIL